MKTIRARVINGRLVVDEPTAFPEGTELDLCFADEGDELSDEERARLHEALRAAWKDVQAGELRPAGDLLDRLD